MTREQVDNTDNGPLVNGGAEAMEGVEDARDSGASASQATTSSDWSGEYTWSIPNVSSMKDRKLYSERFEIGTYSWRLLVFPRGNDNARQPDHIAVYLDFPEAPYTPPHMCPKAHFELVVENQLHPEKTLSRETHHAFTSQATDWGFTQFLPFSDANDPKKGFVIDDTLVLKVKITVQRDERYSYASRKETGYVGLKNQGATCYMNSLLQYLYHLPYFRKAVYHMPTLETDEPERSLPLALQSLFFKLQHSPTSVSTKALTKSFGWGTYDAFMQHDIQEMEAKLCEKLEEKMKGTKVEKVIQYLFVGHYSSHIDCIDVDFKSITQQPFMEIQLEVTGCRDIYASLDKFCEEERLDGQNKYQAEGHGLVDARKYVKFDDFPPVLQLHLKRFDYDYQRDLQIKINDHYEFCSTLDLDIDNRKYLTENSDRSVRNLYKLHSVLVHSGGPHGGHYFAYIRPADKWYKFDDEMVREETEKKAIHDQFGGDDEPVQPTMTTYNTPGLKYAKQSTAYMLVYIRESDWDNISCPCKKEEIAEHIRTRLEAEQLEKVRRQREKEEAHLYVVIKVACDTDFQKQIGNSHYFDLVNFDQVKSYRIHKRTKFEEFRQKVAEDFGVQPRQQRFWVWKRRYNSTIRLDSPLPSDSKLDDVLDLREYKDNSYSPNLEKNALMTVKLYLEMPENPTRPLFDIPPDTMLLFFKLYDPHKRQLSYVTHMFVHKAELFSNIFQMVGKMVGKFPEGTEILGCEEIKFEPSVLCEDLPGDSTPEKSQLMCGDIICLQRRLTDAEAHELRHPTVRSFLEYIQNSKSVNFRPLTSPKEEGFKLELLKTMTYDNVCSELAQHLSIDDPRKLRMTQHNMYAHQPHRNPIKYRGVDNLEAMIMHVRHYTNILYYEILDMPLPELEKLKCLRVQFHNDKCECIGEHQVRLPRDKGVGDLLGELRKELGEEYEGKPMRLMEVYHGKIFKVLKYDTTLDTLNENYWQYRAEVIPEDERELHPGEHNLHVCHFRTDENSNGIATTFGDPFWLRIRQGETLADIKPRIQDKLGIPGDEFAKWKFAFSARQMHHPLEYLADGDDVLSKFPRIPLFSQNNYRYYGGEYCFLGLEHEDTRPRRPTQHSRYTYERPVRIYS